MPYNTGFDNRPTVSMVHVTSSPEDKKRGGLHDTPTPSGVPVRITVPVCKVVPWDRKLTISATEKIISDVFEF